MRGVIAAALAAFLASCATAPPSVLPPVRDGSSAPAAAESRPAPDVPRPALDGSTPGLAASRPRPVPASSGVSVSRPAEVSPPRPDEGRDGAEISLRPDGRAPTEENSAVVALLDSARAAGEVRQYGRAAAALERALKVEPRNPRVWHRLAMIRYRQGRHAEAEALALRSMSIASADPELDSRNWRVVAAARHEQGDQEGAREALRRSNSL